MSKVTKSGTSKKFDGRTVEQWFQAIRAGTVRSPAAIGAFRTGKLGASETPSVPFLIDCLDDKKKYGDFDIMYVAAYALGRIGRKASTALKKLMQLAQRRSWGSRWFAYEACAAIDPRACGVNFWIDALESGNGTVVRIAAKQLGRMKSGAKSAVNPLLKAALADKITPDIPSCLNALLAIDPTNPKVLAMSLKVLRKFDVAWGIEALSEIDTPEAMLAMREVMGIAIPEPQDTRGRRIKNRLEQYETRHPTFRFLCPTCRKPMERGTNRVCRSC